MASNSRRTGSARAPKGHWSRLPESELLQLRICDLDLSIAGSPLEARVETLQTELERRGLNWKPHVWLSTEWFSPNGIPGLAIPFFLAHPRLARLERKHMLQVEGGGRVECLRLLRHEAGHALDNAFRLRRRKRFRETFGKPSLPYRQSYVPNPRSRRFVLNLDSFYAQSHPIEDFAETFAVWLDPTSGWRKRYAHWPALRKLTAMDEWMTELAGQKPQVTKRSQLDPIRSIRLSLAEYYQQKQAYYLRDESAASSGYFGLDQLFSSAPAYRRNESGASFLRRYRSALRRRVANLTGQHPFVVDQTLREMIQASSRHGLRLVKSRSETHLDAVCLLSARTIKFLVEGRRTYVR